MHYYEVAPTKIVRQGSSSFTYCSETSLEVGTIVSISVGKSSLIGVTISKTTKPSYTVKDISSVIESTPLPKPLLKTLLWMSEYYATPLATVLSAALPTGIQKTRRNITPVKETVKRSRINFVLNNDQRSAVEKISSGLPTVMLHGITGSGKTAVYIESAKQTIARGKSVLVIVPEIALTAQLVAEFTLHFEDTLLTHSKQTEAARHQIWQQALHSTKPTVIIGPRSALFTPIKDIGLIIIDECHEPSLKQEKSPRYSALRTASVLAGQSGATVVFGSATPLVSDYYLASLHANTIAELPHLARQGAKKPRIEIIDMTKRDSFIRHRFLSDALLASIDRTLKEGKQTLIFHNRRGSTLTTLCKNCGWQAGCPHCYIPLTLHADKHNLLCHICSYTSRVPTSCPECNATDIIHKGIGTKLIESELRALFPNKKIVRYDGDNERDATLDKHYEQLYKGEIDIIIGTQVVAKGLDLPHLRTVGIIQADSGLSLPDYSSPERTFQLLSQAVGRVGRSAADTSVLIQTYQPSHPSIVYGAVQDYHSFYNYSLALRKHGTFPPFCYLLKLTCSYKTEATAIRNAKNLANTLQQTLTDIEIAGPTPAFRERIADTYRWQIVVKSPKRQRLVDAVQLIPNTHWQFELDPISLL